MIKAYLTAIPTLYEGEDIEVRYHLFQDGIHTKKKSVFLEYMKPAVVSGASLITLLRELEEYKEDEIVVVLNDAALHEMIKGANTTRNGEVIKMANTMKRQLSKFKNITFINVTKDKKGLAEWKAALEG